MKRIASVFYTVLLTLLMCACVNKTQSAPNKDIETTKTTVTIVDHNIVESLESVPQSYSVVDLQTYFEATSPWGNNDYKTEEYLYTTINEVFPGGILRECTSGRGYYTVYKVKEGGCFYVFWSILNATTSDLSSNTFNPTKAIGTQTAYVLDLKEKSAFDCLVKNESTAENVIEIDPATQFIFARSSAITSISLLNDGSVLMIEYDYNNSEPFLKSNIVVRKIVLLPKGEYQGGLAAVLPEDLP